MKNFISYEKEKAKAFNIFTALLCQPDKELETDKKIFEELKSSFKMICPDCFENFNLLIDSNRSYKPLELLVEYTRLFIGPFKILVHPYSCMYFGAKALMSDETLWVISYYEKMGLEVNQEKIKDSPDHIAVETEFLYYLTFNMLKEIENNNFEKAKFYYDGQVEFFNKHYKVWVLKFCDSILENSKNEYYKTLANCIKEFLTSIYFAEFPQIS